MKSFTIGAFVSALAMMLAVATVAQARDIHVDTAQGIYQAIASAQPGDTILIKPGTYNLNKRLLHIGAQGTAAMPIVLRCEGNVNYATLHITAEGDSAVHIPGAYWIFRGIHFEANPSTYDVIQIEGSQGHGTHLTFVDCKVSGGKQASIKGSFRLGRDGLADDDYNVILHSEFYDCGKTALDLDGGKNWVVRGNYVHNYGKASGAHYGIFIKGGATDGLIEGNFVDGGGKNVGISFGGGRMGKKWLRKLPSGAYAPEMVDGICRNNIVVNADLGYHSNDAYQCKYFNNLAYNCDNGYQRQHGYAPGPILANNILSGKIRGAGIEKDNLTHVKKSWFVDPSNDNFTLTAAGKQALKGRGMPLKQNPVDYFGQSRKMRPPTLGPVNADETTSTKWVDARVTGKPTPLPKQTAQ